MAKYRVLTIKVVYQEVEVNVSDDRDCDHEEAARYLAVRGLGEPVGKEISSYYTDIFPWQHWEIEKVEGTQDAVQE